VNFFDIFKNKKVVEDIYLDEPCSSVSFNGDGFTIAVGTTEGKVFVMDLRNLKSPLKMFSGHKSAVADVKF